MVTYICNFDILDFIVLLVTKCWDNPFIYCNYYIMIYFCHLILYFHILYILFSFPDLWRQSFLLCFKLYIILVFNMSNYNLRSILVVWIFIIFEYINYFYVYSIIFLPFISYFLSFYSFMLLPGKICIFPLTFSDYYNRLLAHETEEPGGL